MALTLRVTAKPVNYMSKAKELKRERRAPPPVNGNGQAPVPPRAPPRTAFTILITFQPRGEGEVQYTITPVGEGAIHEQDVLQALQHTRDDFLFKRALAQVRAQTSPPAPVLEGNGDRLAKGETE